MGILQTFVMAFKSLGSNKGRTFLTMLGVIIGVSTFIALVSIGEGNRRSMTERFQSMGTNLITINIMGRNSNRTVTYDDLAEFVENNHEIIDSLAPQVSGSVTVRYENKSWSTTLLGTNQDYRSVRNIDVQSGRFLSVIDVDYKQKVVLLGTAVVRNLFPTGIDPVGEYVKLNGDIYKVIGVLEETQGGTDRSEDDRVIIPVSVAQRMLRSPTIRNFSVKAKSTDTVKAAMEQIEQYLYKVFKNTNSYTVFNQQDMLETVNEVANQLTVFLGAIAVISLLVGGIGIMNIMLVSVTERTKEIGIRKAIGAKRRNIMAQFIIEAIIISCSGGIIGILLGIGLSNYMPKINSALVSVVSPASIIVSFSVSSAIGIFFGFYPAYKASKLNPIQALRFE